MALPSDWQDFWIQNPWAPRRVLREKYGIKPHDVDNWLRGNPYARELLDREHWKLRRDMPARQIAKIMKAGWKYYIEEECSIDVEANTSVRELIHVKTPSQSFQFLVDGHYLDRLPGYKGWIADGYTRVSFAICNIWPGRAFADKRNLLPALFLQTKQIAVDRQDAMGLVKHIYLCFMTPQRGSSEDAKRRFVMRYKEHGFITGVELQEHGMSSLHLNKHGVPSLLEAVAQEFAADLGLQKSSLSAWNGQAFRRDNAKMDWDKCRYCLRRPVDLHHLLPRSEYPDYAYDPTNVVPVCVQVHAAITRNTLGDEFQRTYLSAQRAWLKAIPSDRIAEFDKVMSFAHRETIGFMTPRQ